mgnify:CR=1 FL=1
MRLGEALLVPFLVDFEDVAHEWQPVELIGLVDPFVLSVGTLAYAEDVGEFFFGFLQSLLHIFLDELL